MEQKFLLTAESTVDLPYSYVSERKIPVLFYSYTVDGVPYIDDMGKDPETLKRFYGLLNEGKMPSTSQLNEFQYLDFFEEQLKNGNILHIAFGSGMTPSVKNARSAAEQLMQKYPDKKITVVDSLCSSSGYGLFVDAAVDMRDKGCSMEEIEHWLIDNCHNVHHQFFSTDLKYFKRSGRVSGPTATIGKILNICPIMRLNDEGRIIAYSKARGKTAAMQKTLAEMEKHAVGGTEYSGKCFISNSNCLEDAKRMRDMIQEHFPHIGEIKINDIGTIIASHTGPGTVAVFFFGDERIASE